MMMRMRRALTQRLLLKRLGGESMPLSSETLRKRQPPLLCIATIGLCTIACSTGYAQTTASEIRAVSVLSTHFETLVYAKTDLLASAEDLRSPTKDPEPVLSDRALRLPFLELIGALTAMGPNTVSDLKLNYGSLVTGADNFTSPEGIGIVASRKCYIAVANSGTQQIGAFRFPNAKQYSFRGMPGFTWSIPPFEGHPRITVFYAGALAGTYFVLANDRQTFENIAHELAVARGGRQIRLPNGSPGLTMFAAHEYWVYRQFDRIRAKDVNAAGIAAIPTTSQGLAFLADKASNEATIQVYSFAAQAPTFLQAAPKLFQFQATEAGIWQALLPLSNAELTQRALLEVFYYLGFGLFF
jgi:hypothetical protein